MLPNPPVLRGEIRALTGLRGIAAAVVMLFHALPFSEPFTKFTPL